jgi:ubiquinone/menaquinone biosynthesis C-methylase UbiE
VQTAASYDFDQFSANNRRAEFSRLRRQATVLLDREVAMLRQVGIASGMNAAEIGCGPGFITGVLARLAAPGHTVGIDTSSDLLRVARDTIEPEHTNLAFLDGNAYATGLPDRSLDFVYCRLLYQHLDSPETALREARRLLRPGGRLCVVDVDDAWLTLEPTCVAFDRLTRAARAGQARRGGDREIGRKLPRLMKRAGFDPVRFQVVSVSSLELGLPTFLDLTLRFKAIQIGDPDAESLVEEVLRFAEREEPFGAVGMFVVVGHA